MGEAWVALAIIIGAGVACILAIWAAMSAYDEFNKLTADLCKAKANLIRYRNAVDQQQKRADDYRDQLHRAKDSIKFYQSLADDCRRELDGEQEQFRRRLHWCRDRLRAHRHRAKDYEKEFQKERCWNQSLSAAYATATRTATSLREDRDRYREANKAAREKLHEIGLCCTETGLGIEAAGKEIEIAKRLVKAAREASLVDCQEVNP